jgi:lipoprotein-releasing system permease protein
VHGDGHDESCPYISLQMINKIKSLLSFSPFEFNFALRLIKSRQHPFLSVISLISITGLALGTTALLVIVSVTTGFEDRFREKILGVYPHLVVIRRGQDFTNYREVLDILKRSKSVTGASPSTYDEMMISSKKAKAGTIIKGVDLSTTDSVSDVRTAMIKGKLDDLRRKENEMQGIILGIKLFEKLKVEIGDMVTLISPLRGLDNQMLAPFGMEPTSGNFIVMGTFDSGYYEYDSRLALISFSAAQKFMNRGDIARWIEVKTPDMFSTERFVQDIKSSLEPYSFIDFLDGAVRWKSMIQQLLETDTKQDKSHEEISENSKPSHHEKDSIIDFIHSAVVIENALKYQDTSLGSGNLFKLIDWREMNKNLFSALRLQKIVLGLFFMIIVVVATFNIVGTQSMVIHERIREISILLAMGATRRSIIRIFIIHGLLIGIIGVFTGILLGTAAIMGINGVHFKLDPRIYLITELPANFNPLILAVVASLAVLFSLMTSIYSARRASRRTPVEGLRV